MVVILRHMHVLPSPRDEFCLRLYRDRWPGWWKRQFLMSDATYRRGLGARNAQSAGQAPALPGGSNLRGQASGQACWGLRHFLADLTIGAATASRCAKGFLPHIVGQACGQVLGRKRSLAGRPPRHESGATICGGADTDATGLSGFFGAKSAIEHAIDQSARP